MKPPQVTVQIVTHDNEKTIIQCVRSVQRQRNIPIDILVIDSGSSDKTVSLLKDFRIRTVVVGDNVGYGAAHNIGFNLSKSKFVLTLNPDVLLASDFVISLVSGLVRAGNDFGSAQGMLLRVETFGKSSSIIDSAGLFMTPYRRQGLRYENRSMLSVSQTDQEIFGPDGAAALYRRSMLRDIDRGNGVFDEAFFMHKEDVDLVWRAQLRGWRSMFIPRAHAYHVRSFRAGKRQNVDPTLRTAAVRNRYFLLIKNDTFAMAMPHLIWILMYDIGIFLYVLFREPESLHAYTQLWKELKPLCLKRKIIQGSVRANASHLACWFQWRYI